MTDHLLVRPNMPLIQRPPLGLLYLAGMNSNTEVWDVKTQGEPDEYIRRTHPKTVGVTMMTRHRHHALRVLKVAKEAGCITVAGGPHASIMYKQLEKEYPFIDYIVVGDGEYSWQVLCEYEYPSWNPKLFEGYIDNLDKLPQPAWDAVDLHRYEDMSVVLGRGCDGHCTFCSTWWVAGKYRHHGYEWIAEMLRILWAKGIRHLVWEDDCLTNSPENTDILARALSPYQFKNLGCTRADRFDEYTARELSKVGFNAFSFGIESGSQEILDKVCKHSDLEAAFRAREYCRKYHIHFIALMMQGFPFETDKTRQEDIEFRRRLAPDEWGSAGYIAIYPGTAMYQDYKRRGLITDDFWLGPDEYMRA